MDALRALGNLLVMGVVSLVAAVIYDVYDESPVPPPFSTVWFVAFMLVWALVAMMSGKHKKH